MGTLLGMSGISLSSDVSPSTFAIGGGGAAWLGYDMWVAPEWSTGFEIRVGGSYLAGYRRRSLGFPRPFPDRRAQPLRSPLGESPALP